MTNSKKLSHQKKVDVLNKGFVTLVDHMGSDLTTVNAARISFGKQKEVFDASDEGLIKYLAEHEHTCYDAETEVFTEMGWKPWSEVKNTDRLAAVASGGSFTFEVPTNLVCSDYSGKMLQVTQKHVDFCVTPNHRLWAAKRTATGHKQYNFITAEASFDVQYRVKTTATFADVDTTKSGTYDEGFLYGFFLGDGHRASSNRISFHLKKERKITALIQTLNNLSLPFSKTPDVSGAYTFWIPNTDLNFTGQSATKKINPTMFLTHSLEFLAGVFDGLLCSDGSEKRGTFCFGTTSQQLSIDFQRLGTLLGKYVKVNKPHKGLYKLMLLSRSLEPRLNDAGKHNKWIDYSGKIYCAEVSTGLLLVRRHGKQIISGNSPFRHSQLTFHVKAPIFVFRQWMKHRIGSEFNEISGRYVEFNSDDFYLPEEFRKQAVVNKQGSEGVVDDNNRAQLIFAVACENSIRDYKKLIELGVCREQARCVLPQGMYSEVYWTVSLQAVAHFIKLRKDSHAQWEIQQYADAVESIVAELFPVSYKHLIANL